MGSLFGGGKMPAQKKVEAPSVDDARSGIEAERESRRRRARQATRLVKREGPIVSAMRRLTGN